MTNEAIKTRYLGSIPYFGVGRQNLPSVPYIGNIGFVGRLGGMSPVVGEGMLRDNPFQQVNEIETADVQSDFSLGVPIVRLAEVPEEYIIRAYTAYS